MIEASDKPVFVMGLRKPKIHEKFNKIDRVCIAYIEQEIIVIVRTSVLCTCVDMNCFLRLSHINFIIFSLSMLTGETVVPHSSTY